MLTTRILQVLQDRERHKRVRPALDLRQLTPFCKEMVEFTDKYFRTFQHDSLDVETAVAFYATDNPKADESAILMVTDQLNKLTQEQDPEAISGLLHSLQELAFSTESSALLMQYENGEDVDIFLGMQALRDKYKQDLKRTTDMQWCDTDIEDLLGQFLTHLGSP